MRILHIAYKLEDASAATRLAKAQRDHDAVYFFLGRNSTSGFVRENQVAKLEGLITGIIFHILNIITFKIIGLQKGEIFSINFGGVLQKLILRRIVKKYRIDVVHVHWGGYGFFPLAAAAGINKPVVITAHDYQVFTGGCHVPMNCAELKRGCGNCPLVNRSIGKIVVGKIREKNVRALKNVNPVIVSPSKYVQKEIISEYPFLNVKAVPNTLDQIYFEKKISDEINIENFAPKEKYTPTIITVAVSKSTRQNKGIDILRAVLSRLSDEGFEFNYISIGEYIECKGAKSRIHFDRLSTSNLFKYYIEADVCILPSRYETFSMVALEAICAGVRVVAFDNSGPSDIVLNNVSGRLVPAFDIDKFYLATKEMLEEAKNKVSFGVDLVRFYPQSVARSHRSIYSELK